MSCSAGKRKRNSPEARFRNRPGDVLSADPGLDHRENSSHSKKMEKKPRVSGPEISMPPPPISRYLPAVSGGSRWHAQGSFENMVVIGDSYSKLDDGKTWVDHLQRRLRKRNKGVKIHNFAFPGATVEDDLSMQLSRFFAAFPKKKLPSDTPSLDPDRTTYLIFLGINDCGHTESDDLEPIVETIPDAVHDLYIKAGARNFVLVNVPPIDRSPQAIYSESSDAIEGRVTTWNNLLQAQMTEFGASSKEATVLLFSSHQVLMEVLEDPSEFDFGEDDPTMEGGGIWEDDLHLTTDIHDILAEQFFELVISYKT